MKKAGKILLIAVLSLGVVLALAITFTIGWRPFVGPRKRALTDRHFASTPERLARGRYLTVGLLGCESCHTPKNWTQHGAPNLPGMELAGQSLPLAGLPGTVVASNLTLDDSGSKGWTDDQIARSIREGIGHDDRTIFPMMPYAEYRQLSDEDLAAVVVYVRSVPAVHNPLPATKINFPVNYLVRAAPQPVTAAVPSPNPADPLDRGRYMVKLGCGCHSAVNGLPYAGGEHLEGPWGNVTSANITPDPSGIAYYDEATFLRTMRTGYVGARRLNSIMPFGQFQYLTDDDLKAMFAYLRSVPAVKHHVDNTLPPTYCKLCKQKHGGGDQN
ncbi:MAG TPA: c-type cytochrome [Terriglobales bacterium]|nr:c-type cytochrome [Terriglobales bacterium]